MRFKLFSTEIRVSYLLICLAAISIILSFFDSFLWCVTAVILHEAGHIFAMCSFGFPPEKVKISLFEISIVDRKRQKRTFKQNFLIIFSGPFANFICFILFYLLYLLGSDILFNPAMANLSVGIFNLLPVLSLDGGQLLYLVLCRFFSDCISERVVNIISFIILFPLSALGFFLLINSKYNFSLLLVCFYIVLSLMLKNNRYF